MMQKIERTALTQVGIAGGANKASNSATATSVVVNRQYIDAAAFGTCRTPASPRSCRTVSTTKL